MRKRKVKKTNVLGDPKYKDPMVTTFINNLMLDGKKSTAFKIFYVALDRVAEVTKSDGYETWKKALENVMPSVEVRSRRMGGATFQIPVEISAQRKMSLSMKWLITHARDRKGRPMKDRLAEEIIAASKGEGGAFKKKEDIHRMAEANKAFSHIRI